MHLSQQLIHSYDTPYVFPQSDTFAGRIITSTLTVEQAFTVDEGAYSAQQNLWAKDHFYQNALLQNKTTGLTWHLECFRRGLDGKIPGTGQVYKTTDPAGLPPSSSPFGEPIPTSVDLRTGGYKVHFSVEDTGASIGFGMIIEDPNGVFEYIGTPVDLDPDWYDPLTVASCVPVGIGYGAKATFRGASFLVEHDAGVPLSYGGTYRGADGITPYTDPFPALCTSTAETSNLSWPVVNRNSQELVGEDELSVNGYSGDVFVTTTGTLDWFVPGLTDDEGGLVEFGFIGHGKDPAPVGAGFFVADRQTADAAGNASGTVHLKPGPAHVFDGSVFDAYAYDAGSSHAYSQPVTIHVSDSIQFRGT